MSAQPIQHDRDDEAAKTAMRAQKAHRRAEREEELGLPPRPSARRGERREIPDLRWQHKALCASADETDAHALTEALNQEDAAEVVSRLCSRCPVRDVRLETGRSSLGWGVWGGCALADGWMAPQRPAKPGHALHYLPRHDDDGGTARPPT